MSSYIDHAIEYHGAAKAGLEHLKKTLYFGPQAIAEVEEILKQLHDDITTKGDVMHDSNQVWMLGVVEMGRRQIIFLDAANEEDNAVDER